MGSPTYHDQLVYFYHPIKNAFSFFSFSQVSTFCFSQISSSKKELFFLIGISEKQRILAIMGSITLPITRLPLLNPTSSSFSLPPFPLSNPRRRYNFSPLVITASAVFAAPSDVNNYVPVSALVHPFHL